MALCNNLGYFYYNDTQILLRWKCGQGHIDHFELQPYYCKPVSDTSGKLTPRVYDNIQNVPITSLSDGYYQLLYTCPDTDVAEYINYRVRAISTTYTQTYTENNREKTREVSYWTDTWADAYWMATAQESVAGHEWQRKPESVPSISGTKNGNSSVELHITDASTKTQYLYIERSNNGGSWYVLKTLFRNINRITNDTPWNVTYTDTSVAAGSSFRYRARTRNWNYSSTDRGYGPGNGFGLFGDYSDVIGPYEFKPSSPGNLAAKVIGTGQVKLTWTNTNYTGTSYRIEYSSYDGDPWKINATAEIQSTTIQGTTSVFTVTGLTPAKWKFRVIRINSEGEAVAVTSSGKTYVEATVPEAPVVGLNAISQLVIDRHDTILTLRWYTVQESGATYEVQHSLLRDAWALNVAGSIDSVTTDGVAPSLATNWHAYSYEGLEAGRTHYFRVKKVLDDRYSWSDVAQYTLPLDDTSLDEPTNLVAEEVNGNALLTWSADALTTGESFLVQYTSLENAFDDNVLSAITDLSIASDVVPRNRVTITDLERGAAWYFRIRRLGDNVASAWTQAIQLDLSPDTSTMEQLSPPTTMSTAMSYAEDATVIFSWTHNSSDGAVQSAYEVLVEAEAANGVSQVALLTDDTADSAVSLDLSLYSWPNGAIVYWRVRTQGLYEGYWSDWSRVQQFYVYVQPTASLTVDDTVTSMPIEVSVETQSQPSVAATSNDPIECVVSIAPMDGYEGQEADGSIKWHMPGVPMWTKTLGTEDGYSENNHSGHRPFSLPIDLQGNALRSLPDGTRDELTVDSASNVTLTRWVGVTTQATTDGIVATVGTDAMSTTGDLSDGATVIYTLATPQTIDLGTVELPEFPTPNLNAWTVDSTEFSLEFESGTETGTVISIYTAEQPTGITIYGSSTQDGTPTPEAPVAIESVDELNIEVSGRNIAHQLEDWYLSSDMTYSDGVITKAATTSASWRGTADRAYPVEMFYGRTWTVSFDLRSDDFSDTAGTHYILIELDASASLRGGRSKYRQFVKASDSPVPTSTWTRHSFTFTPTDESWFTSGSGTAKYAGISFMSNTKNSWQLRNVQLELGSTATPYEPYDNYHEFSGWLTKVYADEVLLTSEITYGVTATILTERGMRASVGPVTFTPSWDDVVPMPTASLLFDPDWQYVTIQPRCETSDGTAAQNENPVLAEGVTLSVYRIDPDGGIALIASGLENDGVVTAVDYHANLASCTYRIVARMASTGAQAVAEYSVDTPCYGIIVQWDEEWQDGTLSGSTYEDGVPGYTYTGSRLVIDHNASWQEGHEKQLEHKLYQGEQDPIARYGMGRGETISVNGSVLRTIEAEALAALRTLAAYRGDVYVRVPHGMGFPASAKVTVNGTAKSEVISYSIDFTRVREG